MTNDIYAIVDSPKVSETITDRKTELILFVLIAMAFFLDGLDGTIVTVALPEMAKSFGMDTAGSSWVITVYFTMMAGLILVFGKLSAMGALKKILTSGFVIFSLASLVCAFSEPSVPLLLSARAIQGIGSAMLASAGVIVAVECITKEHRNLALSITVLGSSLGTALGPVLGGVITELISWHYIFFINVPIGIICAVVAIWIIPKSKGFEKTSFDLTGSIILFVTIVSLIYAIANLLSGDFSALSIASAIVFVLGTIIFIKLEQKAKEPVMKLNTFKKRNFDAMIIVFLIVNVSYIGALYLVPFMMEITMNMNALDIGLMILIPSIITLVLCVPSGKYADKHGTKTLSVISCLFLVAGCATMGLVNVFAGVVMLIISLAIFGFVWGLGGGSLGPRIVEFAPDSDKSFASSILPFIVYFANALGLALASALFNLGSGAQGQEIESLDPVVFMNGFVFVMITFTVVSVFATILAYLIKDE